jgi:hypothetical protein
MNIAPPKDNIDKNVTIFHHIVHTSSFIVAKLKRNQFPYISLISFLCMEDKIDKNIVSKSERNSSKQKFRASGEVQ